jgi:uncharacterized protein
MFIPLKKDDKIFSCGPFLKHEVPFNLFYRIIEGETCVALKAADSSAIALASIGRNMWLWIDNNLSYEEISLRTDMLCDLLIDKKICGINAEPWIAESFAAKYTGRSAVHHEKTMSLIAYQCLSVKKPNVNGAMGYPLPEDTGLVAAFCAGFNNDAHGTNVTKESQMTAAERLITSGNLYAWKADGKIVSIANISNKSARHARINTVFTPVHERKKGYASALVAEICSMILSEGLIPMLYADSKNPDSNKVYRNIGFTECGRIDEYRFIY